MTNQILPPPVWVDQPASFTQMLGDLTAQPRLAVDTESNSLHAYREQVCLVQFTTPTRDYVVDPLALQDLSALGPIFSNPDIEKIFQRGSFHSGGISSLTRISPMSRNIAMNDLVISN